MSQDNQQLRGEQPRPVTAKLFSVLGIAIRVHISVLIIFALIVTGLSASLFPTWHPDWTATTSWTAGFAAGLLFFVSLLIHELSHSVVARACGIEISGITLFLFGGMAEMQGEPKSPRDEFLIAGAGPLASFVLAFVFGMLAGLSIGDPQALIGADEQLDLSSLSPTATILMWLSTINFLLAAFNLLPGFPMDGGRLFRAALWWRTGDLVRATQLAARVGSGFGWLFMGLGAVQALGGNTVNGLWLILIGWFIRRLAHASVAGLLLDQALRGFDVGAVMRTRFERVGADVSLRRFIDDYLLRSTQQVWPVADAHGDLGYISPADFNPRGASVDDGASVTEFMQPLDPANCVPIDISARDAFQRLANRTWPLPVVSDGRIVGIVHQADILRWFAFHEVAH